MLNTIADNDREGDNVSAVANHKYLWHKLWSTILTVSITCKRVVQYATLKSAITFLFISEIFLNLKISYHTYIKAHYVSYIQKNYYYQTLIHLKDIKYATKELRKLNFTFKVEKN